MSGFAPTLAAGLQETDLATWGLVVVIAAAAFAAWALLRFLLHRRWHAPLVERGIWLAELLLFPAVVVAARSLLLHWPALEAFAYVVDVTTSATLCAAVAWLVDRAVSLFVLKEDRTEQRERIPGILRTAIRIGIHLLAVLAFVTLVLEGTAIGFVVSWSVVFGVLGLALQGVLQDAFAGISISIEEPFEIGDWIELDDGTLGEVIDISWRATRLKSLNNSIYIVPNTRAANARIHNYSQSDPRYALWVEVNVPNEIDPSMARRLLLEAALATPGVAQQPPPSVNLLDGGSRPYRYLIYFHCDDYPAHFAVRSKLFDRVWRYLRQVGVTATPQAQEAWLRRSTTSSIHDEDPRKLLRNTPLFASLSDNELEALSAAVQYRVFPAGAPIVRYGEAGASLFVIAGGQVRVSLGSKDKGMTELARLGVGQYFGETSLLTGATRTATVMAVTECALLEVGKQALAPILAARPELGEELARVEAERQLEVEGVANRQQAASERAISARARELLQRLQQFFGADGESARPEAGT